MTFIYTELPAIYSETPGIQTTLIYWPAKVNCGQPYPVYNRLGLALRYTYS
jgi:hypothetical protein